MDSSKIIGWSIFLVGIIIISWTLYSSYNIFTGETAVPEVFELPKEEVESPAQKETITGIQDIQAQMKTMIGEQLKGFLPVDTLPKLLNLAVWSMLAGLLIFGVTQISRRGIKLIKK